MTELGLVRRELPLSTVIGFGCLIALITFGARAGFGLFLEPMTKSFGWGRETFAIAMAIQQITWGLGTPFAGALADRIGVRPVLCGGAVIFAAGLALMSVSATPILLYLSAGLLVGIGAAAASFGLVMAAVGRMVSEERRSWALGIIVAASSLGMFVYAPLDHGLIEAFGWANALLLVGASVLLVIPLSMPYAGQSRGAVAGSQTMGGVLREAASNRSFWLLTLGFFVCGYHVAFIQVHLPAYVVDQGVSPWVGGWALALVGLFNVVGSYGAGVLGGRRSKKNLLCFIYLARSLLIAVYVSFPPTAASTLVFAAIMGIFWLSTVPLTSGLVALMFGPRYMATLFGIVFLSHQIGAFLGVWLGGWLYDHTGTYAVVWWTGVGLGVVAAMLNWPIAERPQAVPAALPA